MKCASLLTSSLRRVAIERIQKSFVEIG